MKLQKQGSGEKCLPNDLVHTNPPKIMTHEEREALKDKARDLLRRATTTGQRVEATLMFIEAYYARNPRCPSFTIYAAHYLWASRDTTPKDALKILTRRYPKPEKLKIRTGYSDWNTNGSYA